MQSIASRASRALRARVFSRAMGGAPAADSFANVQDIDDADHKQWLAKVSRYPVSIPHMEWTLEWMLPTPVPLHTFIQPPIVVEVRDRNTDADKLVYKGPNVAGGYPHPITGELVAEESHDRVMRSLNMVSRRPRHVGNDYYHSKDRPEEITMEDLEEEAVLLAVQPLQPNPDRAALAAAQKGSKGK